MRTPNWIEYLEKVTYYAILDTGYASLDNWADKFESLARGGAGVIQVRAKGASDQEQRTLLETAINRNRSLPESLQKPIVMNDNIEVCLEYPDIGLHVGQDDTSPSEARERLGPSRILGLSTHSKEQAAQAASLGRQTLSYFAIGPIFPTQTKPDYTPVGLELAAHTLSLAPTLPFFCIGGINRGNIDQLREIGIRKIVTVSDTLLARDTENAVKETIALLSAISN